MIKHFKSLWKNIFHYGGTVSTREYYLSLLANTLGMYIIAVPFFVLWAAILLILKNIGIISSVDQTAVYIVSFLYILIFQIPVISLIIRRARDSRCPWWKIFFVLVGIPVLGALIIGIFQESPDAPKPGTLAKCGSWMTFIGFCIAIWSMFFFMITKNLPVSVYLGFLIFVIGIITVAIGAKLDEHA